MNKVHYKFVFPVEIEMPESIEFDFKPADIQNDYKRKDNSGNFIITGEVDGAELDGDGKLPVYVSSSGKPFRTWELEVTYNDRKLKQYPIRGTIKKNGFYTVNKRYIVLPAPKEDSRN